MGGISEAAFRLSDLFGTEAIQEMNRIYNRLYWPLLVLFIFKEKSTMMYDGLTMVDFKNALFSNTHTSGYLRDLIRGKTPCIVKEELLYEKDKFRLTTYGKKVAMMMWNHLVFLTKQEGKSIEDYANKIRATLNLEPDKDSVDVEEKQIRELEEENARRAGVIKTPDGAKIDLNRIQVGEQHVNASN